MRNMSSRLCYQQCIREETDLVFAEFEDDVDVCLILEAFLVANDIGMLETLMDFDFSNQLEISRVWRRLPFPLLLGF
jgi:hypothetical protein